MTTGAMSTVVSSNVRRNTIVNLKQVNELPLRNALESFDKNGDGKIDLHELQKIIYWYGLWKYASIGLCLVIMLLVWSTFGLTIWAINLTKDYTVTGGVMTGAEEVVKMSVANTYIPLSWASLLDRRHLDALDSLTIEVAQGNGNFAAGVYHVKVASYVHANSTYIKLFGEDGSRVWVQSGTVVLHHPDANEAVMVCGAAACNTLAVDVKPEYLQQLVQRSAALFQSNRDFELPSSVDGVAISKAAGEDVTCMAEFGMSGQVHGRALADWDGHVAENGRYQIKREITFADNFLRSMWHNDVVEQGNGVDKSNTNVNIRYQGEEDLAGMDVSEESQLETDGPDFNDDFSGGSAAVSSPGEITFGEATPLASGPGWIDNLMAFSQCTGPHCTVVSSATGTSLHATGASRGMTGVMNVPQPPAQQMPAGGSQLQQPAPGFSAKDSSSAFGLGSNANPSVPKRRLMENSQPGVSDLKSVSLGESTASKGFAGANNVLQPIAQYASNARQQLPQYTPDFGSIGFPGLQRRRLEDDKGFWNYMNTVQKGKLVNHGGRVSGDLSAQHVAAEDGQLSQATPGFGNEAGSTGAWGPSANTGDSRRRLQSVYKRIAEDGTTVDIANMNNFGEAKQDDGTWTYVASPGQGMDNIQSMTGQDGDVEYRMYSAPQKSHPWFQSNLETLEDNTDDISGVTASLSKAIQELDDLHDQVRALDRRQLKGNVLVLKQFDMSFVRHVRVKAPVLKTVRQPNFSSSDLKRTKNDVQGIQINLDGNKVSPIPKELHQPVAPRKGPLGNKHMEPLMSFTSQEDADRNIRPKDILINDPTKSEDMLMMSQMGKAVNLGQSARTSASTNHIVGGALKVKQFESIDQEKRTHDNSKLEGNMAGWNAEMIDAIQ